MKPEIYRYTSFAEFLEEWFRYKKSTNQRFTLAVLARHLSYKTPMAAKFLLTGDRTLPPSKLGNLEKLLKLEKEEKKYFRLLHSLSREKRSSERDKILKNIQKLQKQKKSQRFLKAKQLSLFESPLIPAIHEMKNLKGFKNEVEWIQDHLVFAASKDEIFAAIDVLRSLYMWIDLEEKSEEVPQFLTEDEVKSSTLKQYYKDILSNFQTSTDILPKEDRHLRSLSISIPQSKIPLAKKRLNEFMKELQNELSGREPDDVVIQIFSGFTLSAKGASND